MSKGGWSASVGMTLAIWTILAFTSAAVQGTYLEAGNSYYRYPFPNTNSNYYNKLKAIPAVVPISPIFDVEVMKPQAQLEEKKTVTLFIVPQNSLHVFPHSEQKLSVEIPPLFAKYQGTLPLSGSLTTSPGHIPAVEVPLEKPMVLGTSQAQVIAPAGFTVLLNQHDGSPLAYPIQTSYLLAPVPVGTIISPDTPVVLTTIYAVPSLPSLPSAIKIFADFSASRPHGHGHNNNNNNINSNNNGQVQQLVSRPTPSYPISPIQSVPLAQVPVNSYPIRDSVIYPGHPGPIVHVHNHGIPQSPNRESVSVSPDGFTEFISFPTAVPSPASIHHQISAGLREPPKTVAIPPSGIISGTAPQLEPPRIHNSKESPYLTHLREESLKRQIFSLQQQLEKIQSTRV